MHTRSWRDRPDVVQLQVETFGRACAADMDFQKLPKAMPKHPWDSRRKVKKVMDGAAAGENKATDDKAEL